VEPRLPVGEPSSDKVADRQGNHDNADDICPDEGGRSEKWRHEPRRAKLNGHDTHTGEKGEHINVKRRHVHFTGRGVLLGYIFSLRIPPEAPGNPPSHIFKTNRPYRYFQVSSINCLHPNPELENKTSFPMGHCEHLKDVDKLLKNLIQTIIKNMRKAKHMKDQRSEKENIPQSKIIGEAVRLWERKRIESLMPKGYQESSDEDLFPQGGEIFDLSRLRRTPKIEGHQHVGRKKGTNS
jgi:hypothetical protein